MADTKEDDSNGGLSGASDFVQIYLIHCDIIAGHDVYKADTFGKSDPYVKVSALSRTYRTKLKRNTLNPVWNEHVEMTFFNDPKKLDFRMFDWDRHSQDDPIGDCEFVFGDDFYSPFNQGFHGKLPLEFVKKKGKKEKVIKKGHLEVKVYGRKLVPSELENKVKSLDAALEQNAQRVEEVKVEIADLGQQNQAVHGQIDGLNAKIADLNTAIPPRREELEKLKQEEESLDSEEKEVRAVVDPLNEELSELEEELNALRTQIEEIQGEEDRKHTEIEMMNTGDDKEQDSLLPEQAVKAAQQDQGCKCCRCVVL